MSIIQIMCHNGNYWQTGLLDNESAEDVLNRIFSLFLFFPPLSFSLLEETHDVHACPLSSFTRL